MFAYFDRKIISNLFDLATILSILGVEKVARPVQQTPA